MNTKKVCTDLNISPKALRIYEEWDIVTPKRDENNYRNYDENDLLKLRQVILLKELGFSLKDIKTLLDKNNFQDNMLIRSLYLQLNAVENKIGELENIKSTLKESINNALTDLDSNFYNGYLNEINLSLKENREKRSRWIDKWNFDSWARNYDKVVKDNSRDELKLFDRYEYVLSSVRDKMLEDNPQRILDIGCGTGNLCGELSNNIEITGMDQSIEMLIQVKNKYPEMKLKLGNFLDEPYVKDYYDVIVSTYAFHHLNPIEKEKAVNIMLEYLNKNGKIVIADLMFLNETERENQKKYFINQGREDLWEIVEDEYYTDIERIKRYSELLGCTVEYEHLANFTWLLEIKK